MIAYASTPILSFARAELVPDPGHSGRVAVKFPDNKYLSVNPDGTYKREVNIGPFESAKKVGTNLVYDQYDGFGHPGLVLVVPIVEGL